MLSYIIPGQYILHRWNIAWKLLVPLVLISLSMVLRQVQIVRDLVKCTDGSMPSCCSSQVEQLQIMGPRHTGTKQSNLGPKFKTKLKELFLKKATNGSIIGRQITSLCSPFYANPDCFVTSRMPRKKSP